MLLPCLTIALQISVLGVSLNIGFFWDLLGTYRASLSVAGEVDLAVTAVVNFQGSLRYGRCTPQVLCPCLNASHHSLVSTRTVK